MKRIYIGIPDGLLGELDLYVEGKGYERAEFIRKLIREKLGEVKRQGGVVDSKKESLEKYQRVIQEVQPVMTKGGVNEEVCKHGAGRGLCRFGC